MQKISYARYRFPPVIIQHAVAPVSFFSSLDNASDVLDNCGQALTLPSPEACTSRRGLSSPSNVLRGFPRTPRAGPTVSPRSAP